MTDERLCTLAQTGDLRARDELVGRYHGQAVAQSRRFYLAGQDRDDASQEALVGLVKAIRLYDPARGVTFGQYAGFAIHRQLITALIASKRAKHGPLNDAVHSLRDETDGHVFQLVDRLHARDGDPHATLEARETLGRLTAAIRKLSPLERRALIGLANGLSYAEIELGEHVPNHRSKQVDNAAQRAKRKLRAAA